MANKLFKAIAGAFKPREKTETYVQHLPNFETIQELVDFVEKKYQQENAQLRAENVRLKQSKEEEKLKKKRVQDEGKIIEEIYQRKLEIEGMKKARAVKLKIEGLYKPPTFFLKNNRPFHKFMGIYLQETDDGNLIYYPWLRIGSQDVKFEKYAHRFEDFFRSDIGIVSQMTGGKVDSNFDIAEDGTPVLRIKHSVFDKPNKEAVTVEDLKQMQKISEMSEAERREYENKIEILRNQVNNVSATLIDERKEKEELEKSLADKEITVKTVEADNDIWKATVAGEAERKKETTKIVADALSSIQDTKVSQILTDRMNETFLDAFHRLKKKYGEGLYKEEREIEESKQKDLIRASVTEAVQSLVKPERAPAPAQAAPKA